MKKILAKALSYDKKKRNRKDIFYIVIHWTGNKGDTAKDNAKFFATGNTRKAGAHFFVDRQGDIVKSINLNRSAWAVGNVYSINNGAGKYYKKCTNYNSVSIELCDFNKNYSKEQVKAVKKCIKYIRRYCPYARTVIRHWDVNGKDCPHGMTGVTNKTWYKFLHDIEEV